MHGRCGTFVGDVDHANAGIKRQFFSDQMGQRAQTHAGVADFSGLGFGGFHQIGQRVVGRLDACQDSTRGIDDIGDGREVFGRHKAQRFVDVGANRHGTDRHHAQGVAIGLRFGQYRRANVAARPCPVVDHHRLAQSIAQSLGQLAGDQIGHTPRRKGHDHGNRFDRIGRWRLGHR